MSAGTELTEYRAPGVRTFIRPGDLVLVGPATGRRIIVRVKAITIPAEVAERALDDVAAGVADIEPELVTLHAATVATSGGALHPQRGTARAFTAAAVVNRVTGRKAERIELAEASTPRATGPAPRRPRGAR